MKIKDLSKVDLPREKIEKYGPKKLADHELLAILLGSGIKGLNVLELSKRILKTLQKIGVEKIALKELTEVKGLGNVKAAQVLAAIEFGKRLAAGERPEVLSPKDVWKLCADIRDSKREHFVAFYLDTQNRLIERQIISIGTLSSSLVHPRELFEPAVALHAASVILVHNHPSGVCDPSDEDIIITKRLLRAGDLMGISVVDHVIISDSVWKSCYNYLDGI